MDRQAALNNPLVWVLGGALAATWLYGAYHAWQSHDGGVAVTALLLPPYGIYMAVEQELGHPDAGAAKVQRGARVMSAQQLCREDAETFEKTGLSREQYDVWCDCSWQMIADGFTPAEAAYLKENQQNSPGFQRLMKQARESCYSTARYLGAPAQPGPVEPNPVEPDPIEQ